MIFVAHIVGVRITTQEVIVLRVTNGKHCVADGYEHDPCLLAVPTFDQQLFSQGTTSGEASTGIGELELQNIDGSLDYLAGVAFDGQEATVYQVENEYVDALYVDDIYYTGTVTFVEPSWEGLKFHLSNRLLDLDVPAQPATFAGTNNGEFAADGVTKGSEGNSDLMGETKPMVFGRVFNVKAYAINAPLHIYGCNFEQDGSRKAVHRIWSVRDKGADIIYNGNVLTFDALVAASVPAGQFLECPLEGCFKLGSPAKGEVTVDLIEHATDNSISPLVQRVFTDCAGYEAGTDYDIGQLQALDLVNPCPLGIYITDSTTILSVITQLLDSIGAWMMSNMRGYLTFGRMEAIGDTAAVETFDDDIIDEESIEKLPVADENENIPAFKLELQYGKNWFPMDLNQVLESLTYEWKAYSATAYMKVTVEDEEVREVHPLATFLTYPTLIAAPIKAKIVNGDFSRPSHEEGLASWPGRQESGSGGYRMIANNVLYITSGDPGSTYYVSQVLMVGQRILPGYTYRLSFRVTGGTAYVQVNRTWTAILASMSATAFDPTGNVYTLDFTVNPGDITILIHIANLYAGTIGITNISCEEIMAGLTPQQEAERRFAAQKLLAERYKLSVGFIEYKHLEIGSIVNLAFPRYGLDDGRKFRLIGREDNPDDEDIVLDIFRSE